MREGERECKIVLHYFLREGLLVNQDLVVLASLLGELLSLPLETGLTDGPPDPDNIYVGSGAQNSSL